MLDQQLVKPTSRPLGKSYLTFLRGQANSRKTNSVFKTGFKKSKFTLDNPVCDLL